MKYLLLFLLLNSLSIVHCQTWQSIDMNVMSSFKIDPYTNNMWCYRDIAMNVVENNGTIQTFYVSNIGDQGQTSAVDMAFTPGHTYYSKLGMGYGLYTFDNYLSNQVHYENEIERLTTDGDTVFLDIDGGFTEKYLPLQSSIVMQNCGGDILSQNGEVYSGYTMRYYDGQQSISIWNQPFYLQSQANTFNFFNYKDEICIGHKTGISIANLGQCYDTITPNNTQNMPSGNVLEIEFDKNDSLWCLFGDANDDPFAIATLHGDTWVNRIDASNSPIDFDNHYVGFEFDTLGNIWVANQSNLYTLISPSSPTWLSTIEQEENFGIEIYPNPVEDVCNINFVEGYTPTEISLSNLSGELIKKLPISKVQHLAEIPAGMYVLCLTFEGGRKMYKKLLKQ